LTLLPRESKLKDVSSPQPSTVSRPAFPEAVENGFGDSAHTDRATKFRTIVGNGASNSPPPLVNRHALMPSEPHETGFFSDSFFIPDGGPTKLV
jgi:hypothetical protein